MLWLETLCIAAFLSFAMQRWRKQIVNAAALPPDASVAVVSTVLALSFYSWDWQRLGAVCAHAALAGAVTFAVVLAAGIGVRPHRKVIVTGFKWPA